jgi:DegV family protein with EDD domain
MAGATEIVSIHISNEISGTINSARLAKEQTSGAQIEIVDSRCTSAVIVMAVEAAVTARAAGADLAGVMAAAQRVVEQCRILFMVDTLEYLYKGGRIGGAAALVGSLLQFKPLLYFREGKIDVLERVRKASRATARMGEVMESWFGTSEPVQVIVMHALCPDKVEPLAALLREHLNITHLRGSVLTPALGTHSGPGTVGICCCPTSVAGTILDEG